MEAKVVKGESIYYVIDGDEKSTARSLKTASASARASLGYSIMRSIETGHTYNIAFTETHENRGIIQPDFTMMFFDITASITEVS
jgi:hypothetical protein